MWFEVLGPDDLVVGKGSDPARASVVALHGTSWAELGEHIAASTGLIWVTSSNPEGGCYAVGYDPEVLRGDGLTWSEPKVSPASVAVKLWRPSDMATIHCLIAHVDADTEVVDQRRIAVRLTQNVEQLGEGTPVVVLGVATSGLATDVSEALTAVNEGAGIAVSAGISVDAIDHTRADLGIRHRRQVLADRPWTRPGAIVTEVWWWYQPERSSGTRCASQREADRLRDTDNGFGGFVSVHLRATNPDGSEVTCSSSRLDDDTAGLAPGDLVEEVSWYVRRHSTERTFDDPATALRNAHSWNAVGVGEWVRVRTASGATLRLSGNDLTLRHP